MTTIRVSELRPLLSRWFDEAEVCSALRVMLRDGLIPHGESGFGGCRSAPLHARQVVLLLLSLASDVAPSRAPAEAERIGAFRLLRFDSSHSAEEPRSVEHNGPRITLIDALVSEVERFDPPDRVPSSWAVSANGVCQISPSRAVFGPSAELLVDPSDPDDRVVRSCRLPGRLLADVAELFHQDRAEAA